MVIDSMEEKQDIGPLTHTQPDDAFLKFRLEKELDSPINKHQDGIFLANISFK